MSLKTENFFQEMTFEYDAFKDAVYISSQAAKDLGIDEIIYHPKIMNFLFLINQQLNYLRINSKKQHLNPEVDLKIYAHIGKQNNGIIYKQVRGGMEVFIKDLLENLLKTTILLYNIQENIF